MIEDAIGEHYYLYLTKDSTYFIYYKIIGQKDYMEPGYIVDEGIMPIPKDLALLIQEKESYNPNVNFINNVNDRDIQNNDKLTDIISELFMWHEDIKSKIKSSFFNNYEDLIYDLKEMLICLNAGSYRGCLAMAGISLERILKEFLNKNQISYEKDWTVGRLLGEVEKSGKYIDPSLKNIWNIINVQRIVGVHAKEKVPIPSRDQALMVVYAVKDTLNRVISEIN